jgi:hypothetical protein
MKTKLSVLLPVALFLLCITAYSQKYKTAADTVKLNQEYIAVSNQIADLSSRLTIAQNNLPGYHTKAGEAAANAQATAIQSTNQADKAVNGDVGDAKKAKRKAKKAVREAKDARHANNNVENQDKKIAKLTSELQQKQRRLQELDIMRNDINSLPR